MFTHGFRLGNYKKIVTIYGIVLLLVLIYGEFSVSAKHSDSISFRAACIMPSNELTQNLESALKPVRRGIDLTPVFWKIYRKKRQNLT